MTDEDMLSGRLLGDSPMRVTVCMRPLYCHNLASIDNRNKHERGEQKKCVCVICTIGDVSPARQNDAHGNATQRLSISDDRKRALLERKPSQLVRIGISR